MSYPRRSSNHWRRDRRLYPWAALFTNRAWMIASAVLLMACGLIGFVTTLGVALVFQFSNHSNAAASYEVVETNHPIYATSAIGPSADESSLSSVFAPEIQYWAESIKAWALLYQIDPNLIATVIQIESCGDPFVSSPAGAQGLFQVMPFHFTEEEDMLDVQTNAKRGLDYLLGGLEQSDGHVGLALAGYNGGHGVINRGWAAWAYETQRYYYWGARIYAEAVSGMAFSPTLQEWLDANGQFLCDQASESQRQRDLELAALSAQNQ
ncbi:MAG: transglycosylase SLT domain-containing protein [Anaerolineae bacterium]|nr:transglycosylase SLT domain-containing protein [Anaerolineae bacterium]